MKDEIYPFVMRNLPYEYSDLAPCISAQTLIFHHDRIYKDYVDRLNHALADYPLLQELSLKELLSGLENLPDALKIVVKNNGGGVYAHELYFDSLQPLSCEQDPKGDLLEGVIRDFGSLRDFREKMKNDVMKLFGCGYVWLVLDHEGVLSFETTANQDIPDLNHVIPILNIDVWEHSYYLQYQMKRSEYASAWLRLINWGKAACRYEEGLWKIQQERLLCGELPLDFLPDDPLNQTNTPDYIDETDHSEYDINMESYAEFAYMDYCEK